MIFEYFVSLEVNEFDPPLFVKPLLFFVKIICCNFVVHWIYKLNEVWTLTVSPESWAFSILLVWSFSEKKSHNISELHRNENIQDVIVLKTLIAPAM